MAKKVNYSFLRGCGKVSKEDYSELNQKLKDFLECKTLQHYYLRRRKFMNMPAHIKEGIEKIFSEYGIAPDEIWDITEIADGHR